MSNHSGNIFLSNLKTLIIAIIRFAGLFLGYSLKLLGIILTKISEFTLKICEK